MALGRPFFGGPHRLHACRVDTRFSFGLLLPGGRPPQSLVVVVHDSTRQVGECLDAFGPFAAARDCAVLAPLFPANVLHDGNEDGYKFLAEGEIRYDLVLNAMVDQVAAEAGCPDCGLLLHGYSGGGQFAHRYWLLHPERLRAVVIGAPGEVTLLDDQAPWWPGVRDTPERFGRAVDVPAVRQVAGCLLVGEHDVETDELMDQPPSRFLPPSSGRIASNRKDRLAALHRSLRQAGIEASFEEMPDASHSDGLKRAMARAQDFFAERLGRPTAAPTLRTR